MLKKIKIFLLLITLFIVGIPNVEAKEKVNLYLFWGDGCPHCAAEEEFLSTIENDYDNLTITRYEVWNNEENAQFLQEVSSKTNKTLRGVPVTVIGETIISGFSTSTEQQIKRAINYYSENSHHDIIEEIKNGTYEEKTELKDDDFLKQEQELTENTTINLPLLNKVDLKNNDLLTTIPILSLITVISLSSLLLLSLLSVITTLKEKRTKQKLLPISLFVIVITTILNSIGNLSLDWIFKIIIILISLLFVILKLQNKEISERLKVVLIIILAISIGMLINRDYIEIYKTLVKIENLTMIKETLYSLYFIFSSLIYLTALSFIVITIYKKLPQKIKTYLPTTVLVITMFLVIYLD